jgi:hypothetical protein
MVNLDANANVAAILPELSEGSEKDVNDMRAAPHVVCDVSLWLLLRVHVMNPAGVWFVMEHVAETRRERELHGCETRDVQPLASGSEVRFYARVSLLQAASSILRNIQPSERSSEPLASIASCINH